MPESGEIQETTKELRKDIDMLAERMDSHIEDSSEQWKRITNTTEINASAIAKAIEAMDKQNASTNSLVEAWTAANGFYKVVKWISGLGGITGLLALVGVWLVDKFPGMFNVIK